MEIWYTIRICGCTLGLIGMPLIIIWVAILTTGWLRDIRNNLHSTWDDACRPTAPGGIRRRGRSTESLSKLLYKGLTNVVGCDMDCISNSKHNQ